MQQRDDLKIVMVTMDFETSEAIFIRSDGKEARLPLGTLPVDARALARIHATREFGAMLAVTKAGDEILFELPMFGDDDRRRGRVAVYLDQNQWRVVANALQGVGPASSDEREAVRRLVEWVRDGRLIMPASAAHYHETTKWSDSDKRNRLGLTILQLSRGWQVRDPLQVRRDELRLSIIRHFGLSSDFAPGEVISLDSDALYSPLRGQSGYATTGKFSPEVEFQVKAMTVATASIETMLDVERIEDGPDTGWTAASQRFSDWLDNEERDRQQKRNSADAILLSDLAKEIAEESAAAGATPSQMKSWLLKQFVTEVSRMAATGLFRELLHERHLNKNTTWTRNDLTDMIYLSCAAGYADFVVCERHMRSHLAQAVNRLDRPVQVFRRLPDLIQPLEIALRSGATGGASGGA